MTDRTTTKQRLLNVLKREDESSMKEIMVHFTISEIAVRRHLRDLIRQGFISEKSVKQEIGRPFHLYTLTGKGHETFPNQHKQLPLELLQDLEELQGEEAVQSLLLKRKKREESELLTHIAETNFDEKVQKITEFQNEKGYMLEYEKTDEGDYSIKNYNCPIYNLASSYREICRNEKEMLRNIFNQSHVSLKSCMTKEASFCAWTIKNPHNKTQNEE